MHTAAAAVFNWIQRRSKNPIITGKDKFENSNKDNQQTVNTLQESNNGEMFEISRNILCNFRDVTTRREAQ